LLDAAEQEWWHEWMEMSGWQRQLLQLCPEEDAVHTHASDHHRGTPDEELKHIQHMPNVTAFIIIIIIIIIIDRHDKRHNIT